MQEPIRVYGAETCADTQRSRRLLEAHHVPYTWIDVDTDQASEQLIRGLNKGARATPTIVFADGTGMIEPSDEALARKLGLLS
ncbi:MAG: NrdH-redoxin [Chloroflexi bacterium]|nr:NrdH-redoxin [Chloroflexota bacterium]